MTINQGTQPFNFKKISYLLIAASFFIIVYYNLNSMLIAGIISFFSFKVVIRWKEKLSLFSFAVRIAILLNILILVAYFIRTAGISLVTLLRDYHAILNKMVSIMSDIESKLPDSLRGGIPDDMGIIKAYAFDFLKNNTTQTINFGKEIFESVVNVILGIVVGGIIAFEHSKNDTPFKKELFERITLFSQSFKKLLEAQAKISAINALFTSIFLLVAIPLIFNATIPFSVAIIIFTFIFGLIPIIGNLISNAII
ncbi:MAG: hypothetical protein NT091_02335, partial [Candidatus Falkowbacteria bacterium]|nr:hypothetical protein [Candidatus Falkowbacteria bacterium]